MPDDRDRVTDFQYGGEPAAEELFDQQCERLLRLARRRIGHRTDGPFDPEDVAQSAFRTFLGRVKNDEFAFADEDDTFKLLVRLTVRKTLRRFPHHRADGQPPEVGLEVALIDEFERVVGRLPELDRQVLELKVQGFGTVEIAERLGTLDLKVRRIIERLEGLAREQDLAAG